MPQHNMKLSEDTIEQFISDVDSGLSNKDACAANEISEESYYSWMRQAKEAISKKNKTDKDKLCIKLIQGLKGAKASRRLRRIEKLEEIDSPAGLIFLLKNDDPKQFNKKEFVVANFDKLEQYMQEEYSQSEIEDIRKAIFAAEERREQEIEFDEDEVFKEFDDEQK